MALEISRKRETGLDMLRILAMFMVVICHAHDFHFGRYGLDSLQCEYKMSYIMVRIYQVFGVDGVNVFALLTGYLCIQAKWHPDRYVRLWLQAAFYGLFLFAVWWVLACTGLLPQNPNMPIALIADLIYLPGAGIYWYVVAYTGLFFLIPFINKGLHALTQERFRTLLLAMFGVSVSVGWKSPSIVAYGYSTLWLIELYVLGAYFRLYAPKHRPFTYGMVLVGLLAVKSCLYIVQIRSATMYSSVFDVAEAVLWLLLLRNVKVQNKWVSNIITWLAIGSFGVYLIHTHPFAIYLMKLSISRFGLNIPAEMWWIVPVWSICIYLICAVIDQIRRWFFALLRANAFCTWSAKMGALLLRRMLKMGEG